MLRVLDTAENLSVLIGYMSGIGVATTVPTLNVAWTLWRDPDTFPGRLPSDMSAWLKPLRPNVKIEIARVGGHYAVQGH